ncbi:hypothetical protein CORC01_08587 [Colletotrichum orchidophilum]|uniref:Uncharacterized protein n=1 Tax=Colletotrichum orchidophilum TaxID=1209926 RepID=A0A1G4B3Q7_9PEZI|nr:uncharacterized protein CORC01_08587 [Colletotrichum orchidophilum]OHE96050.1 hypothetical protein CORC01_08587 [Colletotrichum orchidophilum]
MPSISSIKSIRTLDENRTLTSVIESLVTQEESDGIEGGAKWRQMGRQVLLEDALSPMQLAMELSSSLTDLSAVSSPDSFRTAFQSPAAASENTTPTGPASPKRMSAPASLLPRELKEHCQIYLEEHLYNGALGLYNSLLTAGYSRKASASQKPVPVPPLTHLALLNTLTIHPSHTTRAPGTDRLEVCSQTLDYLRNLLAIVGPINAGFRNAFQFHGVQYGRRNRYHDEEDEDLDGDQIGNNKLANEDSIWQRAQDFWAVLGWAFNCSRLHPHRWRFWKTWLQFMMDVLETDIYERKRIDEESLASSQQPQNWTNMRESILVMYIKQKTDSGRGALRMILQAVFADGCSSSTAKFPEVFNKETKGLPSEDKKRKRMTTLDIENDQFGDYFNEELTDSEPSEAGTPGTPRIAHTPARKPGDVVATALADSIPLRLRLMELLSEVAYNMPEEFMDHNEYTLDLCRLLKQQPLSFFHQFVTDMGSYIQRYGAAFKIDFLAVQLDQLLPSGYEDPKKVTIGEDGGIIINADVLKLCYLGHHANTIDPEDNARVALILESLLHMLPVEEIREARDELRKAAAKGIEARKAKAKGTNRRSAMTPSRRGRGKKGPSQRDLYAKEMMDLAVSGLPTSGKTTRAKQLQAHLAARIVAAADGTSGGKQPPYRLHYISDSTLSISRDVYDLDPAKVRAHTRSANASEKDARAVVYGAVKRVLSDRDIVILDGMNYIKGWRYQLHCEAKAVRTPSVVLQIGCGIERARGVNEERLRRRGSAAATTTIEEGDGAKQPSEDQKHTSEDAEQEQDHNEEEQPYDTDNWENLVFRYEEPNPMTRWDSPLFTLIWDDDAAQTAKVCDDIWDAVAGTGRKVIKPNQATVQRSRDTSGDYLYVLDRETQDVVKRILEAQAEGGEEGGEVKVSRGDDQVATAGGGGQKKELVVQLPGRKVGLPQLQRLRRAFVGLNRGGIGLEGVGNFSAERMRESFVGYLNDTFEQEG